MRLRVTSDGPGPWPCNEEARNRRHEVLTIPARLTSVGACLTAADNLVKAAAEEASTSTAAIDARERAELEQALGFGTKGARPRQAAAAIRDLEDQQKARAKRIQRDALDRVLTELTTFYRDVLALQTGALAAPQSAQELHSGGQASGPHLINGEIRPQLERAARASSPERTLRRIDAIIGCRVALETNVAPLLAMEALLLELADRG